MNDSQFSQIGVLDESENRINPATEETLQGLGGLISEAYDYVSVAYPDTVTEIYTFKDGGSGGTVVAVITIVYTDNTKLLLSTVEKT